MPKIIEVPGLGQVEFPDNMDDYHIAAKIKQHLDSIPRDVTQDMSGMQKFMAGAGKAVYDVGRGVGNIVTDIAPGAAQYGFSTRADTDKSKKVDANLMNTGAGLAGNIAGGTAIAAPLAFATGGASVLGGAAIGAGTAAIQPVGTDESRMQNMAVGGALGGALPAALRAGKVAKAALVDQFTPNGRLRIVGGGILRAAADPADAAANMAMARGATPGFNPTAGQASNDAGVASLERAARAIDPAGFGDIDTSQRSALINALRSVAKTPEDRAAAITARETAVKPLYATAKAAVVDGDPAIDALLKRPSMGAAKARAAALAAERGDKFAISAGTPEQTVTSGLLDAMGNPIQQTIPAVPGKLGGTALHDLKMGLDDAIGSPGTGGMQGAERAAALGTKADYLGWLENKIPAYGQAKSTYADMSKPINQMDIGQELYNRFVPPLADGAAVPFRATADAYARALNRNGDKLAANVTGMNGAKLESIMEPGQMDLLRGVVSDSQMKAAAENIGRGVGSDTVQKMAMSHIIDQSGLPSWIGAIAPLRSLGGMVKTAGDIIFTKNDETMRHLMADVLKDPPRAAEAMQRAGVPPSKYAEVLKKIGVAGAVGTANTANNQQQN
jgi:hypothetical protein